MVADLTLLIRSSHVRTFVGRKYHSMDIHQMKGLASPVHIVDNTSEKVLFSCAVAWLAERLVMTSVVEIQSSAIFEHFPAP